MDPIEWLKSLLAPPTTDQKVNAAYRPGLMKSKSFNKNTAAERGIPSWLDSLYRSPVADSLYQTSDVPAFLGTVKGDPNVLGEYNVAYDLLNIRPEKQVFDNAGRESRSTLIHEMGHKYRSHNNVSEMAPYTPTNLVDKIAAIYTKARPESKATLNMDDYYQTDPQEAYAQAFKNAFNFLAETARDPKMDYRKFAGDLEANTPGMGLIVQDLMKLPIYAKHPLQGQMFREAPNKKEKK